jgi:transcriptional regulator with XRE-family HTH domain
MPGKRKELAKLLKDARVAAGLSQTKAAKLLGVERQTVGAWERGINGPLRDRAVAVAKLYKIDVGQIDPFARPVKIIDTIVSESHKIPLLRLEKITLKAGDARDLPNSLRAYANDMLAVHESFKECFAISVGDNSMKPLYQEGDICIIDPAIEPNENDAVVVGFPGEALVLRTYVPRGLDSSGKAAFDLQTPNADFKTLTVNSSHPADVLGVVVEFRRKLR